MPSLKGHVAIVTGASRGIGRAIALGLAREGCDVVIVAKSTESTEKLPGSIFTVAAEVEALGARALPVQVDVRDADQIEGMAAKALERFGRIDLLINNAGALHWAGILDTPPKRFDLVMGVNARAAFLCLGIPFGAFSQQTPLSSGASVRRGGAAIMSGRRGSSSFSALAPGGVAT